jgi:S-adenosyl-L-methionine methyltransferase
VEGVAGAVFELGLGNGRTYDHLRQLFPDRPIYVCERAVAAHPFCIPPSDRLFLGDMRRTLPQLRDRFAGRVALAHLDPGSGDIADSRTLALALGPLIVPLLAEQAVLVSEPALALEGLLPLDLPAGVGPGRYHLYRRVSNRNRS